jgi:hypothetical protein
LALLGFQSTTIFQLVATLCDGGDTTWMLDALVDDSNQMKASKGFPKANPPPIMEVSPWHVITTKLHELPTRSLIDRACIFPNVVVVGNEHGAF